jgi:hypothetical protein
MSNDCGLRFADCGFEGKPNDCGLRIADCGFEGKSPNSGAPCNPHCANRDPQWMQSAIRNPQSAMEETSHG